MHAIEVCFVLLWRYFVSPVWKVTSWDVQSYDLGEQVIQIDSSLLAVLCYERYYVSSSTKIWFSCFILWHLNTRTSYCAIYSWHIFWWCTSYMARLMEYGYNAACPYICFYTTQVKRMSKILFALRMLGQSGGRYYVNMLLVAAVLHYLGDIVVSKEFKESYMESSCWCVKMYESRNKVEYNM